MTTTFKYQARDASGKTVKGTMQAASQSDVVADLRRRHLTPLNISKKAGSLLAGSGGGTKRTSVKSSSVKKGELEIFTRQLSTMLSSGIPMLEARAEKRWGKEEGFRRYTQNTPGLIPRQPRA